MEVKEILAPKNMMIALGTIVIVMSLWGMTHGDEWAEYGWGEDNVLAHVYKLFDECVVNARDHVIRCQTKETPVTYIHISIDILVNINIP